MRVSCLSGSLSRPGPSNDIIASAEILQRHLFAVPSPAGRWGGTTYLSHANSVRWLSASLVLICNQMAMGGEFAFA